MNILFLITEYNPFHNGHLYHIEKAKEITGADYTVAIMSGNFVQRGEPALLNKWSRTEMALSNGIDLVIELPFYYSTASAEYFASAAIETANLSGICDCICFGAENGDLTRLRAASRILLQEDESFKQMLKDGLKTGLSYPTARSNALERRLDNNGGLFTGPNNILAIEYLKALEKTGSSITPFVIERKSAPHHSTLLGGIASASAIRGAIRAGNLSGVKPSMPASAFAIWERELSNGFAPASLDQLSTVAHYLLATTEASRLSSIMDIDEGLENRLIKSAVKHSSITGILSDVKTKRYTYTRLQRAILHLLLSVTKADFEEFRHPQYIRVLGFRRESAALLTLLTKNARLPVVINLKHAEKELPKKALSMLKKEIQASDLYDLTKPDKKNTLDKNQEYRRPIVIL